MATTKRNPQLDREQLLAARPSRAPEAKVEPAADGGLRVSVPSPKYWFFKMPEGSTKTFELDEIGRWVWDQCDGRTTVLRMIESLAKQHKLNLREAEVATLTFLQMLSAKRLIGVMGDES